MADYCVYWFRKAHDHLPECTSADPVAGRAGLVGTQNIRNNYSREGGLDYIAKTGTIIEAIENQPWSGEAKVHVSIANWAKTQDPVLLPKTRRLWFKVQPSAAKDNRPRKPRTPLIKDYELDFRDCDTINPALSDQTDVSAARALQCNTDPQRCFNGQMLGHEGFLLSTDQLTEILRKDGKSREVVYPYLNGVDALTGAGLDRFVIDFEQRNQLQAAAYSPAFEWVKTQVLPDRERKATEGIDKDGNVRPHHKAFLARWWQLSFGRPEMLSVIKPLPRYLACAYVTKRPIFMFVSSGIRPSNLIQVFAFADDYSFAVLQSHAHWLWFITKCGKLKSDFRYSAESVFDTFPWPQFASAPEGQQKVAGGRSVAETPGQPAPDSPAPRRGASLSSADFAKINAVAAAGRELRRIRAEALPNIKGGLRALYRTLELPGTNPLKDAHAALDSAVLAAYGFSPKKDLLAQLLALNQTVALRIEKAEPVTPPGLPKNYPTPKIMVTDDSIEPAGP